MHIFKDLPKSLQFGIFDFDNGIVDTESVFSQFDCELLNEVLEKADLAPELTPTDIRPLAGNSGSEKLRLIANRYNFPAESYIEAFNTKRSALRKTLFKTHPAPLAKGLEELLSHISPNHALATNKKAFKLHPDMAAMGIEDMFDIIVTSDELNKKPAPDVILKAMEQLNAPASQCVYFGDNITDIEAALAANICAVGFIIEGLERHDSQVKAMADAGAHAVIDNYLDVISLF